jgi:hypothetical protein
MKVWRLQIFNWYTLHCRMIYAKLGRNPYSFRRIPEGTFLEGCRTARRSCKSVHALSNSNDLVASKLQPPGS